MRKPGFGESNVGAMAGAVVGSIGGLFALGLAPAIVGRNITLLFATPILGLFSWLVSLGTGWMIGGQIGPRLGENFRNVKAEAVGGAIGGLIPVVLIALWGWYMITPR